MDDLDLQLLLSKRLNTALKEREIEWKLENEALGGAPHLFVENLLEELETYRNFCLIVRDLVESAHGNSLREALKDSLELLGIDTDLEREPLDNFPEKLKAARAVHNPEVVFLKTPKDCRYAVKQYIKVSDRLMQLNLMHLTNTQMKSIELKCIQDKNLERRQRGRSLFFRICEKFDKKLQRLAKTHK